MPRKQLVAEALIDLHRRLSTLATRSHERRKIMQETANLYGVSEQSLYRALAQRARPRALRRSDRGTPRILPQDKMEYYCELIAALKVRTSNKKGRHLSTGEAIRLIEEFGVETPEGLIKAQKSIFKITTVNRYLRQWGYDDHGTLRWQPIAVRFQAEFSNDCWQSDRTVVFDFRLGREREGPKRFLGLGMNRVVAIDLSKVSACCFTLMLSR